MPQSTCPVSLSNSSAEKTDQMSSDPSGETTINISDRQYTLKNNVTIKQQEKAATSILASPV